MPASPVVGMLACWHAGRWSASEGGGEKCWHVCAVGMHPSMPAPPVVGMLACWDANQQHRQTSMTTTEALAEVAWPWLWMLVCTPASSTQHPAILGYTRGCWPCGHVPKKGSHSKPRTYNLHYFAMGFWKFTASEYEYKETTTVLHVP